MSIIAKSVILQGSSVVCLARVRNLTNGNPIVTSDITSTVVTLVDENTKATTVTGSTTIYSNLQLDARWSQDATGYNVAITIDGTYLSADTTYQVVAKFNPTSGPSYKAAWQLQMKALLA